MRLLTSALWATVVCSLLCGCAGGFPVTSGRAVQLLRAPVPSSKAEQTSGIYISEFYGDEILGYRSSNKGRRPPLCSIRGGMNVNDVAVDGQGNLIDPDGASKNVVIFKGPEMCGQRLGAFRDVYGQPSDAASQNAATGKIAVGNIRGRGSSAGSLSICTLRAGCTSNLTNPKLNAAGGVAMSNDGDCWVDARRTPVGGAALIYFKGCAGPGEAASGFKSKTYGGIDIDNQGNLVIIDQAALAVSIYSGCNPGCTLVGGPFALKAQCFFGKLNAANTDFVTVNQTNGVVDFYSYSTKAIKFEYSFKRGLQIDLAPQGIAQNPRSPQ
ncbi:MAG: hypothetical protein ABSF08_09325 [Candidatus Cybelea sp.]|jgi:hypothetical protein